MAEYDVCEGFTVQHYGTDDWFPVVDADWWEHEWLGLTGECEVDVITGTRPTWREGGDDFPVHATWSEIVAMLESLGDCGPYGEGPVFQALTYNSENDLSDELLVAAGWVDVSEHALTRGVGSPLLRAVFAHMGEYDWSEIGRVYVVATARGGCYGWSDTIADVYVSPNMDDDYDVARWGAQLYASETAPTSYRGSHPIYDTSGGWGDSIPGLGDTSGYPYGQNEDRLPMYDVSDMSADWFADGVEYNEPRPRVGEPWLACGEGGVYAIGTDGRVHRVWASVD